MIANGSFEVGGTPETWKLSSGAQIIEEAAHHGQRGVRLTATEDIRRPFVAALGLNGKPELPVAGGLAYRIAFGSRTVRYSEGYNAYVELHWLNGAGKEIGKAELGAGQNVHEWILCQRVVVAPKEARTVHLELAVLGAGIVCDVDEVTLGPLSIEAAK